MIMDGDNREKLSKILKEIEESQTELKSKIATEVNEDEAIKKVLSIVKNNGKLSVDNQISYMKFKGITFDFVTEDQAKEYLSKNTYYYKVTAFRKNFEKINNKYINLDFGLLNDLATIDMYLRYTLIKINLDIEHALKSLLVNTITDSKSEDGYKIVSEYDDYCKNKLLKNPKFDKSKYISVDNKIMSRNKKSGSYHYDLYVKRRVNPPIWVLIELMSFGELIRFVEFYYESQKSNSTLLKEAYELLKYTKNFRDSAAHSRPLLLNITFKMQIKPTQAVTEYATKSGIDKLKRKQLISNKKIHDFICMLIIHEKYIESKEMRINRKKELEELVTRCVKRKEFYVEQEELKNVYEMFIKVIANYNKE